MTTTMTKAERNDLAGRINSEHRLVVDAVHTALDHAVEAGRLLNEAKLAEGHGGWTAWLEQNVEFSVRTAQGYMRVAERWPELKAQRVADLSLRGALKLLAAPAEDRSPQYIPDVGQMTVGTMSGPLGMSFEAWVVPSDPAGFYHVVVMADLPGDLGTELVGSKKPMTADLVAVHLDEAGFPADSADWSSRPTSEWPYNQALFESNEDYLQSIGLTLTLNILAAEINASMGAFKSSCLELWAAWDDRFRDTYETFDSFMEAMTPEGEEAVWEVIGETYMELARDIVPAEPTASGGSS